MLGVAHQGVARQSNKNLHSGPVAAVLRVSAFSPSKKYTRNMEGTLSAV